MSQITSSTAVLESSTWRLPHALAGGGCRSRSETEPLSRPELSHRGGCELEFSCNFPLNPASTSPAHLAASLRAWLGLLYPGDLAVELFAKGNGCLEETQSCH